MSSAPPLRLTSFKLSPDLERSIIGAPSTARWLNDLGKAAVPRVKALTPKRLGFLERGVGFVVYADARRGLVLRIFNSDFKAGWYEFGTERTAARPSLRPGTAAALPGARWGEA